MSRRFQVWVYLACFLFTSLALAQTTGSVQGVVKDDNGAPIPGVTISIVGDQMPLGRTTTTRSDGVFQFFNLVPGNYRLKAELAGMGSFQQDVVVSLAKVTEVWLAD